MNRMPMWCTAGGGGSGTEAPERSTLDRSQAEGDWMVIVFDNDHNSYEEVIGILTTATGCTLQEAYIEAWEIDHFGKSRVHFSSEHECRHVGSVISTIGIRVEVCPESE